MEDEADVEPEEAQAYRQLLAGLSVDEFYSEAFRAISATLRPVPPTPDEEQRADACFDEAASRSPGLYARIHADCLTARTQNGVEEK